MADEVKKEQEGKKEEEVKKAEGEVKEPTITEDELIKTIKDLEDIIKAGKKAPVKEEEEEEEEEDEEEEEKSVTGNFEEEDTLAKAIEVSDFLAALVDQTEASLDMVADRVESIKKSAGKFDEKFIGGLSSIEKVLKSLEGRFDKIEDRLKKIEETPATTVKSVVKSGTVLEKSFNTGGGQPEGIDALPKRKVMELMEKAVADGKLKDHVLFNFEGSPAGFLTPDQKEILKSYLG